MGGTCRACMRARRPGMQSLALPVLLLLGSCAANDDTHLYEDGEVVTMWFNKVGPCVVCSRPPPWRTPCITAPRVARGFQACGTVSRCGVWSCTAL